MTATPNSTHSLTKFGISTTTEKDCLRYETFRPAWRRCERIQWDYRDATGELHSGIAKTLDDAKNAAREFGYCG
jgi:hypothetical protein